MVTLTESPIVLRDMQLADLETAIELSQEMSWPHRREDWQFLFGLGEGIVATIDGRIAGSIMSWRFGTDYAKLGLLIVAHRARGRGIARMLMEAMLERLDGRNVMLSATQDGMPLLHSLGFVPCGMVHQHQGTAPTMPLADLREGERVRPLGQADLELPGLYSRASGMDRSVLFEALACDASTIVLSRDHEPVGFGMLRRFGRGGLIGPIVAPDLDGAKVLATHWLGARAGRFCRMDVVEGYGMSRWLEEMGLPKVATLITMVRGTPPAVLEGPRVFGLATQALG